MKMAYLCSDKLKTIGMHSIHHEILRLALPSIISNITVPLLGLVDLTIVGHLGSEVYIGAIAVGTMISMCSIGCWASGAWATAA